MTNKTALDLLRERIEKRRIDLGLTQKAASIKAGISFNGYSRIKLGSRGTTIETAERIANALGCELWELLKPDEKAQKGNAKGYWTTELLNPFDEWGEEEIVLYKCSLCGAQVREPLIGELCYCSHCGAEMEKDDNT